MIIDQAKVKFDENGLKDQNEQNEHEVVVGDHITTIGTSDEWTTFKNNQVDSMFSEWNR